MILSNLIGREQTRNVDKSIEQEYMYEVGLEFDLWSLVFDLFRSSKV